MVLKSIIGVACACLAIVSFGVNAALYNMTAVLDSLDFGFSGFHYAGEGGSGVDGDGRADTGSSLAAITGLESGSYNSTGGVLNAVFILDDMSTVTLSGAGINFDGAGLLLASSSINISFSNPSAQLFDTTINFAPGYICCGNNGFDPNSFKDNGAVKWMSLWGSDDPSLIGMDLRVELTAVPIPAAVWLFGSGLLGIVGMARRKA
jgi:hypothetical protein